MAIVRRFEQAKLLHMYGRRVLLAEGCVHMRLC